MIHIFHCIVNAVTSIRESLHLSISKHKFMVFEYILVSFYIIHFSIVQFLAQFLNLGLVYGEEEIS